ncbi:hypothetical protein DICPUDRAFT_156274 [Dictyostelium purpureum]|uniref:Ras guanine nucleotide exchange factor n=1 Tax=Dictyostelium purpureum TaxID=5786 RepID=F0ZW60_DICPU|nr:uncharacterized protein DICPUDRAFT_156274 [Dictyostelium purpureum]EGC31826.1 hypothetical protein DICPUDRAFT_156274 [Dictyostelium purpureum]|eukprot:XP_003291660.1 hypothetical protein DICPUDRAFT_156274 [Dictyostelium purpureum]
MDEVVKNGPLNYWNTNSSYTSNNDETSSNISGSNSNQNLNSVLSNNNNNNNNSQSSINTSGNNIINSSNNNFSGIFLNNINSSTNPDSPRYKTNINSNGSFSGLPSPSPPISPRAQVTAPNLSNFITQHTPPPSPKLEHLENRHLRLQHTSHLIRNLSFSSVNSTSSLDFRRSLQQSTGIPMEMNTNNNNNNIDNKDSVDLEINNSNSGASGIDSTKSFTPRKKRRKENRAVRRFRRSLSSVISSNYWIFIMIISIIFVLFIDDILGIAGSPSSKALDSSIMGVRIGVIAFFIIDIIFNLFCFRDDYFPGTIVFWLDLISLASIVSDVHYFSNFYANLVLSITVNTRIIRICGSFIRISLISTLYNRFLRKQTSPITEGLEVEASKLGDKLIRLTTNKIVLLALAVLFASQLLVYEPDAPGIYIKSTISSLEHMANTFGKDSASFNTMFNDYLTVNSKLLYANIINDIVYENNNRISELQERSILKYSYFNSEIWIDNSYYIKYSCILHLCLTIFVILILIIINLLIVNDAHWLVINPLENVLTIVKLLSKQNSTMIQTNKHSGGGNNNTNSNNVRNRVESIGNKSDTADTTSSSGVDVEEPDEADFLLGVLNDIDDSLQQVQENLKEEANQNTILKKDIEDLYVEKYILQVHLRSVVRKIDFPDPIGNYLKKKQVLLSKQNQAINSSNEHAFIDVVLASQNDDIKYKSNEDGSADFNIIQYASIDKLIEKLTTPETHDLKFANVFLLTYRKYLSPLELLERLIIRFCSTPTMELPEKLLGSKEQVEKWRKNKQEQIRNSVFNTLKLWVGVYNWDFYDNPELSQLLNSLVNEIMPFCKMDKHAAYIDSIYKRKMNTFAQDPPFIPPPPLTPEEIAELMVIEDKILFTFDTSDLAIQITLIEFDLFKNIKSKEFLNLCWTNKQEKTKLAPNVIRFIEHFNSVSFWLQTQIVKSGKVKERVQVVKKIIALGDSFIQLNNFYGAMEVLSSLESSAVSRLHKTWEQIPQSTVQSLHSLQKLLSPTDNFKNYREKISKTTSSCIPYIGLYLSDLTFIHEGNPDYKDDLINFSKQREVAATINSIKQFQNIFYYYEPNQAIRKQLEFKSPGADTIWKMSLTCENKSKK